MSNTLGESISLARLAIVALMLFEWTLLYIYGPRLLKESKEPRKVILRACAGLTALGIIGIQGQIYLATSAPADPVNRNFITVVFLLQHLVGVLLVLRAALKSRSI